MNKRELLLNALKGDKEAIETIKSQDFKAVDFEIKDKTEDSLTIELLNGQNEPIKSKKFTQVEDAIYYMLSHGISTISVRKWMTIKVVNHAVHTYPEDGISDSIE